ncbi:endospore germination permease [Halobacillus sp. Marseille-Q1614]|uniref:GerAB/ArcD/ProY family transporter n=1 Tax=Halobacillus sp. Marseille-Q1614 TaxID=2709134 RepID=UPI00156FCDC9|nr:endospore germination permease [Halobacillus sp. Marseille-Q1614]
MENQTNRISRRQFFFIIIQTQIGVGVLTMPFELHTAAKQDGWMSLLAAGIIIQIILILFWLLAKRHSELDYFQIQETVLSKWIGKFFSVFYIIYFIGVGVLILIMYGRMISLWVLPNTPFWVLSGMMVFVSLYIVCCRFIVLARVYTMFSFLLIFMIFFIFYTVKDIQYIYLFPMGQTGFKKILMGIDHGIIALLGFIVSLMIYSQVEGKAKDKLKTIIYAHWAVTLFYLAVVLVTFTVFSTAEMALVSEPVLYMLKSYQFPVLARVDLFFIALWMVFVATSYSSYLYMSTLGMRRLINKNKPKLYMFIIAILTFITSLSIGYDVTKLNVFSTYVAKSGYVFSVGLPILVLIVSLLRKKTKKEGAA